MFTQEFTIKKSLIHGKGVFANRDFQKGEEITIDMSFEAIVGLPMKCTCGSKKCKKIISGTLAIV